MSSDSTTMIEHHRGDRTNMVEIHHQQLVKGRQLPDDDHDIAAMGREQVFIRKFSFWSALGIAVCCSGSVCIAKPNHDLDTLNSAEC